MPNHRDPGTLSFDATIERSAVSGSSAFGARIEKMMIWMPAQGETRT